MTTSCTVLIASADLLPALSAQLTDPSVEVLRFPDAEILRALEAITKRRPSVVALERVFSGTPRGAALINRIKADPSLRDCEIQVVTPDDAAPTASVASVVGTLDTLGLPRIDQRGTRRAPRFKIDDYGAVVVEGKSATLLDLSNVGAQVILPSVLKPNQRVQMTLSDETGVVRFSATIVWAAFEIPTKGDPRYRVGIEFIDADPGAVEAFCSRHRAS